MLDLFRKNKRYFRSLRINPPPSIIYILDKYALDIEQTMEFYNARETWVNNRHVISRMLRSMSLNVDLDLTRYILSLDRQMGWVTRHYNIASVHAHGKFIGKDFYIHQELYDDYFELGDWQKISPIKPMMTDYSGLRLDHPLHMKYEYSINYLDIKALAIQFYHWFHSQVSEDKISDVEVFVAQYPLSNMIPLYANLSLIGLAFRDDKVDYKNTHSIFVYDRTREIKNVFKKFRKYAKGKRVHFSDFMSSIPLLDHSDGLEYLKISTPIFNSYNFLPYFFLYGWYIRSMYRVVGKSILVGNHNEISDLNTMLRYYRSTRSATLNMGRINQMKDDVYDFVLRIESRSV